MLVARPSKRTGSEQFSNDMRFDILAGERVLGRLSCDRKDLCTAFTLDDRNFSVEHMRGAEEERLDQAVARLTTGRLKPPPDLYELKDEDGCVLAVAAQAGEVFQITRDVERFCFAKGRSLLLFDLSRDGDTQEVGQGERRGAKVFVSRKQLPETPKQIGRQTE